MWFRVLSLVIAAALLGKAVIALVMRERFYAERGRQYATASPPGKVRIASTVVVGFAVLAWYATLFHYQPWGWIVTTLLTLLAVMSVRQFTRWETHRQKMLRIVGSPKVSRVDYVLLVVGMFFVGLALVVY